MPSPAAHILGGLPPGVKFDPTDDELIGVYLLARVRGQPDPVPGVIIDDDAAANTQPWKLFRRHGCSDDDDVPAFFYVHTDDAKASKGGHARQDRRCHDGGSWKSQKREREHELRLVDGETIKWTRHNLNLQMNDDRGSVGWVMREYTITTCPSLKICRISFTGHCKKRKFEPACADHGPPQRLRVATADDGDPSTSTSWATTALDQALLDAAQQDQKESAIHQLPCFNELADMVPPPGWVFRQQQVLPVDGEPAEPCSNQQFDEQVPATTTMDAMMPTKDDAVYWGGYEFV